MRQETKDKLDRLVARDRRKLWLLALGGVAIVASLAAMGTQPAKSRSQVEGIVRTAYVQADDAGQRHLVLEVELATGQRVRVASFSLQPPEVGEAGHADGNSRLARLSQLSMGRARQVVLRVQSGNDHA